MSNRIHLFLIPLVTLVATGYYTYFGQMVPQKEVHPPEDIEIGEGMPTEKMVEVGQKVFEGKGTCISCHKLQGGTGRFPDLGTMGSQAGTRKPGMTDVEYLAESLYRPNDFILTGFNPGMPQINKAPIELSDNEIKTVIAYLQSLGGTPTITMDTKLKWEGESGPADKQVSTAAVPLEARKPDEILKTYMCGSCHSLDAPVKLVGPSLFDIGKTLDKAALLEAILYPDAKVAEGSLKGLMGPSLEGFGFYKKVSSEEMRLLVDYLEQRKGN